MKGNVCEGRRLKTALNAIVALASQVMTLGLGFPSRTIFVRAVGVAYLGMTSSALRDASLRDSLVMEVAPAFDAEPALERCLRSVLSQRDRQQASSWSTRVQRTGPAQPLMLTRQEMRAWGS